MGIEVWIENDHSICCVQIDADASRPGSEEVYKDVGIGFIEFIHAFLPNALLRVTILDAKSVDSRCKKFAPYESQILVTLAY